jgi:hypothetical protein
MQRTALRAVADAQAVRRSGVEVILKNQSVVERLAPDVIRLGADSLEAEYKDGYEQVFAVINSRLGHGIARFVSSTPEAALLRHELHSVARRRRRMTVDERQYELRGRVYESFGEDAFRVELRSV